MELSSDTTSSDEDLGTTQNSQRTALPLRNESNASALPKKKTKISSKSEITEKSRLRTAPSKPAPMTTQATTTKGAPTHAQEKVVRAPQAFGSVLAMFFMVAAFINKRPASACTDALEADARYLASTVAVLLHFHMQLFPNGISSSMSQPATILRMVLRISLELPLRMLGRAFKELPIAFHVLHLLSVLLVTGRTLIFPLVRDKCEWDDPGSLHVISFLVVIALAAAGVLMYFHSDPTTPSTR